MQKNFQIGCHRGFDGCTDHDFYQFRDVKKLSVENTLESIIKAFEKGAAYIETDAVMSQDGVIFTLHNVVPKDHFFGNEKPSLLLNEMNFSDIQKYQTGRSRNGIITPLSETLDHVARLDPHILPWAINIEIKGVQGSGQNYETNGFIETLAKSIQQSSLPQKRILFSSFSLKNILALSHLLPSAHYGMLYQEKETPRAIYADRLNDPLCQYLPFDKKYMTFVKEEWLRSAHPKAILGYAHPEITTITADKMELIAEMKQGVNCWALFEKLDPGRLDLYREIIQEANKKNIPVTVITDYFYDMKNIFPEV